MYNNSMNRITVESLRKRAPNGDPMAPARLKYNRHKNQSKYRGIDFCFSFEQWYDWWLKHGVDKNTDTFSKQDKNRLCMCRYNDEGAYSIDNVFCDTHVKNAQDSMLVWQKRYYELLAKYNKLKEKTNGKKKRISK